MEITPFLKLMVQKDGSDLFFSPGAPVHIKIQGEVEPLPGPPLDANAVSKLAYSVMTEMQVIEFEREMELNLAVSLRELGRFRVNVYRQRGDVAMVVRYIRSHIPSLSELNLPERLAELVTAPRGLVLVVGSTGSGKSTTLASMIEHRNRNRAGHILTIEDPIEYLHAHQRSIVDQREVGLDTLSYANALKNAMREAPDVILIGEIRDRETMQHAIAYAETGHLCLSTLHANNANQTLDRIVNFFPEGARSQLLMDLSLNLRAVVSQRLVSGADGRRYPAVELMLTSPLIAELIRKGEIDDIKSAMEQSTDRGMQTFDQSLYNLCESGCISAEEAVRHADSPNDLALRLRMEGALDAVEGFDEMM